MTTKDEVRDNKATTEQEKQMAYEQALKRRWEAELLAKKRGEIKELQKNIKPLYQFGDVVIDSKRTQDGTVLGQMKAYLEVLSILTN